MKVGRNDPCPCGSGKKYKRCCLAKDQAATAEGTADFLIPPTPAAPRRSDPFLERHRKPSRSPARARAPKVHSPPPPPDPVRDLAESRWRDFKSTTPEGRIEIFRATLNDAELMPGDPSFEMLRLLHADGVASGNRLGFVDLVNELRERRPEMFAEDGPYYSSWCLLDALAENRLEAVAALAREIAAGGANQYDEFNLGLDALAYHGQLAVLVEVRRIAWPSVKTSENIMDWAIVEFSEKAIEDAIYDYLDRTPAPELADPVLLGQFEFFVDEVKEDVVRTTIAGLTGKAGREWHVDEFALRPPRTRSRDDWDDETEEDSTPDPGAINLSQLIVEFIGYLHREEGVPYPRAGMVKRTLYRYFLLRHHGDLDPRPSMLERAMHPELRLPKPPRPVHPLCPERVTFEAHFAGMMGMFSSAYHAGAALFQVVPGWLRFLESRGLIDSATRRKVVADLTPLHWTLLRIWKDYADDPTLYRHELAWPEDAARGLRGSTL